MTLPVKQNPYSYAEFLEKRDSFICTTTLYSNVVKSMPKQSESLHGKLLNFPKSRFGG